MVRPEALCQHLHVPHAVQYRQDHRIRADRGRHVIERGLKLEGLHRQQDGVERLGEFRGGEQPRRQGQGAVGTDDLKATRAQLRGTRWPHQERDVAPRLAQASTDIAAG